MWWWFAVAQAGPAEHTERVHARHEAKELELLGRGSTRPGVTEQAIAVYLDRYGALDTRAVRRIEAWGASLQPAWPDPIEPAPVWPDEAAPLAVPADEPPPPKEP